MTAAPRDTDSKPTVDAGVERYARLSLIALVPGIVAMQTAVFGAGKRGR